MECEDWLPCNIRIVEICRSGDGQGGVIGARFSKGTINSAPNDCFIQGVRHPERFSCFRFVIPGRSIALLIGSKEYI